MKSVIKINIFGLKVMVKIGIEKLILKSLHVKNYLPLLHWPKFTKHQ